MNVDAIPDTLKDTDRWLLYDDAADTPRRPHWNGDFGISWKNPSDWHTFTEAVETAAKHDTWGIEIVIQPDAPFYVIDIDGAYTDDDTLREWVPDLDCFTDGYMETSPSGTGIHIPVNGTPPEWWRDCQLDDHEGVDVLTNTPCTVTGDKHLHAGDHVTDVDAAWWLTLAYTEIRGHPPNTQPTDGAEYTGPALSKNEVKTALEHIDPDLTHTEWINIGYAVNAWNDGNTGKQVLREWSRKGTKYDDQAERSIDSLWNNATANGKTSVGTLVHHAKEGGWSPPAKQPPTTGTTSLDPADVVSEAGYDPEENTLKKLNDREKAYGGYTVIDNGDRWFLATRDGTIYHYSDGVWSDDGTQHLREIGPKLYGPTWGKNLLNELIEQVRSRAFKSRRELGAPKNTIAVENGLLDVETGTPTDHDPDNYALNKVPVAYDPNSTAPRWEQFLAESVEDGKQDALEEYIGYCLLEGQMPFARALLLVGGGSNGKTTFLNTIDRLLGDDNTTGFSLGELSHDPYYAAQMFGALANIDADVTGGIGYGGIFKKLTGGDKKVSARHPYGEPFSFHPTTKQLYSANEVPSTKVDDDAFFRRWLIVEFPNEFTDPHIPGPDKDPGLEDELAEELPGILNRAVTAVQRLLEQGYFTNEDEIYEKRERWQAWGDTVDKFISEWIETGNGDKIKTGDLYETYSAFCRQELGETPESQSTLTSRMKKLDGVKYSSDYRFDGKKARGVKGVKVTFAVDDTGSANRQTQLSQADRVQRVLDEVREHAQRNGDLADVEAVLTALEPEVPRDAATRHLENLLANGRLMEPANGKVRTT